MPNFRRVFQQNSYLFITVSINNRKRNLLTHNIEKLRYSFGISKKQTQYEIYAISIMPEHFHMIIKPDNIEQYPKIISLIKKEFTKSLSTKLRSNLLKEVSQSKINKRESGVWQRRYYEHTIRDEQELNHLTNYIHYNPVKHKLVKRASDWEFSSFHKFLKIGVYDTNWCDFTEKTDYE